ncbi:unnamed protein product [Protopolystoma xenopodis]|uniref:Uncharacterized protein n=1 Tax=Protopolystoma xenopodis TaxID=117903 RepID=A0A3S5CTR8_9PLAT|nr:unnamed protein product [Protopolystoma xenopodis]
MPPLNGEWLGNRFDKPAGLVLTTLACTDKHISRHSLIVLDSRQEQTPNRSVLSRHFRPSRHSFYYNTDLRRCEPFNYSPQCHLVALHGVRAPKLLVPSRNVFPNAAVCRSVCQDSWPYSSSGNPVVRTMVKVRRSLGHGPEMADDPADPSSPSDPSDPLDPSEPSDHSSGPMAATVAVAVGGRAMGKRRVCHVSAWQAWGPCQPIASRLNASPSPPSPPPPPPPGRRGPRGRCAAAAAVPDPRSGGDGDWPPTRPSAGPTLPTAGNDDSATGPTAPGNQPPEAEAARDVACSQTSPAPKKNRLSRLPDKRPSLSFSPITQHKCCRKAQSNDQHHHTPFIALEFARTTPPNLASSPSSSLTPPIETISTSPTTTTTRTTTTTIIIIIIITAIILIIIIIIIIIINFIILFNVGAAHLCPQRMHPPTCPSSVTWSLPKSVLLEACCVVKTVTSGGRAESK